MFCGQPTTFPKLFISEDLCYVPTKLLSSSIALNQDNSIAFEVYYGSVRPRINLGV